MFVLELIGTSLLFIIIIYFAHVVWDYVIQNYSKRRIVDKDKKRITIEDKYISPSEKETMASSLLEFANNISEKV